MGRWKRDRPMSGGEIEQAILDVMDELEEAADEYERRALAAADAETAYRKSKAKLMLTSGQKTGPMIEAYAIHHSDDLLEARNITAALEKSQAEANRLRRTNAESLRTLAASQRSAETGRG